MNNDRRELEARLARLERSNRFLLAAALVLGALFVAGFTQDSHAITDLVRAQRIQLVDGSGRVRIDLRHDTTETGLFILDESGGTRIGVAQFAHGGGGFALHGPDMKGAAVLYLKGQGSLTFFDETGEVTHRIPNPSTGR
jgi:hypothetical protein